MSVMKHPILKPEWEATLYWDESGVAMVNLNGGHYTVYNTSKLSPLSDEGRIVVVTIKNGAMHFVKFAE